MFNQANNDDIVWGIAQGGGKTLKVNLKHRFDTGAAYNSVHILHLKLLFLLATG
jgi:hypothetical protein